MIEVGIIMGSASDAAVMQEAASLLEEFEISYEMTLVSAHRTPHRLYEYATNAAYRGLKVIIAGAGGAAHLPGMVASLTPLPVIGVPILSRNSLGGWDSLLSIVQMPAGLPVATVAVNAAPNAALLAIRILATSNPALQQKIQAYMQKLSDKVLNERKNIEKTFLPKL